MHVCGRGREGYLLCLFTPLRVQGSVYAGVPIAGDATHASPQWGWLTHRLIFLLLLSIVVLYGYQGADSDAEQRALTEQLFDAALGELGVVCSGSA